MKNIFIIFIILLFQTNIVKAANDAAGYESNYVFENNVNEFNKWLYDNGHHQYVTTKEKGTGLGLAIVKKIVDEHSGTFWLENNTKENGACAVIRLPIYS